MQHAILWPEGFIPGFADNFASNEVIVAGLAAADAWPLLAEPHHWPTYYANAANIRLPGDHQALAEGLAFAFDTFGFDVQARCTEFAPPAPGRPGRVAWHGWVGEPGSDERLDVHHAWLVEELDGGRLRILTQETQNGAPAKALAAARPNPMINGHQDWLDGLVAAARRRRGA